MGHPNDARLHPVGAAEGCDLLILFLKSKDRSLRQLLQGLSIAVGAVVDGEGEIDDAFDASFQPPIRQQP
ncbi:hypothetical protein SAMN04488483_3529 [Pseudomonas helmanticensis]|uniref:Uncharacterized protein n=1 Tax=Pseudomonas helmanticensis TaxID=1471381 RepID=A0ACD2U8C7_9PSED|nr:hypothetical protein SAMN04488483_3529 [Pseudomonas helmanticensis]